MRPNVDLAREAGLVIGETGAIQVDDHLRTSDPHIYAAGDCAQSRNLVTGRPAWVPLGSTANKQGRVAAINVCGGDDVFRGVLGTGIFKVFDDSVARTGLSEKEAREAGFDVVTALTPGDDKPDYMPDARLIMLKSVADRATRRLLGVQAVGPGDGARRIDIAAMAITAGMTVDALAEADISYAPPYSPAMDNIIVAANVLRNKIDGVVEGLAPHTVKAMMDAGAPILLLDVRGPKEVAQLAIPGATNIPLGALRRRLAELPSDRRIVAFCKVSLRGYEAALIARAAGHSDAAFLDGGIVMWPFETVTVA